MFDIRKYADVIVPCVQVSLNLETKMDGGGAYGAGMAGGSFDPVAFIKKPQVILRIGSWVSSKHR